VSSPLLVIDYSTAQSWVSDLTDRLAPATVLKNYQILSKTLNGAVKAGMIPANRTNGIQLPSIEVKEQRFLTAPEINILAQSIDPRYRTLVLTMAYGGLRRGEAFALRRSRVDLMRRRLDVVEATSEVAGTSGVQFGPPKTKAGHRQVPLPRVVVDELIPEIAPMEPDQLVWTSPNGGVLRPSFRSRFWMPAVKRAGLDGLRLHDLRHTAVSLWIHAGAHNKAVATWAGHASVASVIDRYGHLMPDTADPVMAALDAMSTTTDAQVIDLHR
jgi:integrase